MDERQIISLLCPTRGRILGAARMLQSLAAASSHPERIEVLFYVDDDDPEAEIYRAQLPASSHAASLLGRVQVVVGEAISISKSWNVLAGIAEGTLMMMANDDLFFVSLGWDARLDKEAAKYPDEIFCIWFDDGYTHENIATFPIVSRRWVDCLGFFTPGIFEFWYNDKWIMEVARKLDRLHYISDMLIEHRHFYAGRAVFDDTYKRNFDDEYEAGSRIRRDTELFDRTEHYRQADADKLRPLLGTPPDKPKIGG